MWLLAITIVATVVAFALRRTPWAALSLGVSRWIYAGFIILALLYFPAKSGFRVAWPSCEWQFGPELAGHSLTNYPHMVLFALFFLLTYAQLRGVQRAVPWTAAACLVMGSLVELAQGVTAYGHCRTRDLIPDAIGAIAGGGIVLVMSVTRRGTTGGVS